MNTLRRPVGDKRKREVEEGDTTIRVKLMDGVVKVERNSGVHGLLAGEGHIRDFDWSDLGTVEDFWKSVRLINILQGEHLLPYVQKWTVIPEAARVVLNSSGAYLLFQHLAGNLEFGADTGLEIFDRWIPPQRSGVWTNVGDGPVEITPDNIEEYVVRRLGGFDNVINVWLKWHNNNIFDYDDEVDVARNIEKVFVERLPSSIKEDIFVNVSDHMKQHIFEGTVELFNGRYSTVRDLTRLILSGAMMLPNPDGSSILIGRQYFVFVHLNPPNRPGPPYLRLFSSHAQCQDYMLNPYPEHDTHD